MEETVRGLKEVLRAVAEEYLEGYGNRFGRSNGAAEGQTNEI